MARTGDDLWCGCRRHARRRKMRTQTQAQMGIRTRVGTLTRTRTRTRLGSYFDSKVLSRQHAEIWEETGKIFIKDVKSSNGTFINSERLSLEGMESDPWELKSDDIVEFGIDIVGDDNKILHYKVASRVFCLFNEQDLQIAHRSEQHQHQQRHQQQQQRSTTAYPVGPAAIAGMGGMGEGMRAPGKSVLTFEHILNRLQGELQKSRETGTELQSLNGTMSKVHDTLGGSLPSKLPPYPHISPPSVPFKPWTHPNPNPKPALRSHQRHFQTYKRSSTRLRHPSPPTSTRLGHWRISSMSRSPSNEMSTSSANSSTSTDIPPNPNNLTTTMTTALAALLRWYPTSLRPSLKRTKSRRKRRRRVRIDRERQAGRAKRRCEM
ncbi:hypothetical protein AB1N83_014192 [Pleurotus pulmonarius]